MGIVIGLDPGKSGAIAVLGTGAVPSIYDVNCMEVESASTGKTKKVLDINNIVEILRPYSPVEFPSLRGGVTAGIEKVHAFHGQGVTSAFDFGMSYGILLGVLTSLGIPYTTIEPTRWKKAVMDGMGKEKEASVVRAMQLYPEMAYFLSYPGRAGKMVFKHDRADALLIAHYTQRNS